VDGSESERGGFMGHPMCEFCGNPFYGDNELYMHMSTEHYTCHICQRYDFLSLLRYRLLNALHLKNIHLYDNDMQAASGAI